MKKVFFTLLFSIVFLSLSAQDFEIVSVESLPADMSAREEMKTDHNDHQCALLRIATQNIAPEQRERFVFKSDLGSEVVERASRNGEIWLWVSPGLKYLRIQHPDWGQYELRLVDHVARVEALHTYKVTIKGTMVMALQEQNNNSPTQQYLAFQIHPVDAILEVNGKTWQVEQDGSAMEYVPFGKYDYQVRHADYHTFTGSVVVDDPNNTHKVVVNLLPNFGWIEVSGDGLEDASVFIDNALAGKVPFKSKALKSGQHDIRIVKKLYNDYSDVVTVKDNETTRILPKLKGDFANITLKVDSDAEIWVNNERKGVRTWTGPLSSGTYKIECKQANHETTVLAKEITPQMAGHTIMLEPPRPIYGSLDMVSTPNFATLYIDGMEIGETPKFISEMLIGTHKLKLKKEGYDDYSETISINKGERKQMKVVMNKNNSGQNAVASTQLENVPVGAISGLFSVSETRKVYFSKGNLQYQTSTNTWRFAENQWDCIGNDNSNVSLSFKGWIDLFGWGTGDRPIAISEKDNDYESFVDWGSNLISNGGMRKDLWRTLSAKEWQYVFLHRYTSSGIRYAKAVVNGVKGMIILPDSWNKSIYPLNGTNNNEALFESNEIDARSWSKLESIGVVFLPAAGSRSGISIYDLFSWGKYWTASRSNSNSSNYIYFGNRDFYLYEGSYLHYGRSVRLVQDYQP